MTVADIGESGALLFAYIHALRATGVELASRRAVYRRRNIPRQHDPVYLRMRIGDGCRRKERLGVGMQRVIEYLVFASDLDHTAEIHDSDMRRYVLYD